MIHTTSSLRSPQLEKGWREDLDKTASFLGWLMAVPPKPPQEEDVSLQAWAPPWALCLGEDEGPRVSVLPASILSSRLPPPVAPWELWSCVFHWAQLSFVSSLDSRVKLHIVFLLGKE